MDETRSTSEPNAARRFGQRLLPADSAAQSVYAISAKAGQCRSEVSSNRWQPHEQRREIHPNFRRILRVKASDGEVLVSVTDDGIGISKDLLPHVFELFAQGERTSDRSQGCLGLGLALVKTLVELHFGTVFGQRDGMARRRHQHDRTKIYTRLPTKRSILQQKQLT